MNKETIKYTLDFKEAKTDQEVFDVFNKTFDLKKLGYEWTIGNWDGLNDFLWGFIQGPDADNSPSAYGRDVKKIEVEAVNTDRLKDILSTRIKSQVNLQEALRDSFEHIKRSQTKMTTAEDVPVFRDSTFKIVS